MHTSWPWGRSPPCSRCHAPRCTFRQILMHSVLPSKRLRCDFNYLFIANFLPNTPVKWFRKCMYEITKFRGSLFLGHQKGIYRIADVAKTCPLEPINRTTTDAITTSRSETDDKEQATLPQVLSNNAAVSTVKYTCHEGGGRCTVGPVSHHGSPKISVGWPTVHLAPPIIGSYAYTVDN